MDYIFAALEGLGSFFGLAGNTHDWLSGGWHFAEYLTSFGTWLLEFGQKIAGFFGA